MNINLTGKDIIEKLKKGNAKYINAETARVNISSKIRKKTSEHGQDPYAIVLACADSRVIPEAIFSADLGDLMVVRIAGNVIDNHQLGSIEYAVEHLSVKLMLVLDHTRCGMIKAAINDMSIGYMRHIVEEVQKAIGNEKDDYEVCKLNVLSSVEIIRKQLDMDDNNSCLVAGAIYNIETGEVEFL